MCTQQGGRRTSKRHEFPGTAQGGKAHTARTCHTAVLTRRRLSGCSARDHASVIAPAHHPCWSVKKTTHNGHMRLHALHVTRFRQHQLVCPVTRTKNLLAFRQGPTCTVLMAHLSLSSHNSNQPLSALADCPMSRRTRSNEVTNIRSSQRKCNTTLEACQAHGGGVTPTSRQSPCRTCWALV